jgi:two-component system, LuxR family, response regulator FixJ
VPPLTLRLVTWQRMSFSDPLVCEWDLGPVEHHHISGHADVPMAVAAIKSGAEDFIEKPVDDTQLVAAINRALARTFEQQGLRKSQETLGLKFARLTPRQVEIFDLVVQGFTSHAIAAKLNIGVRTVESYRGEIMEKMQAESVAVLVRQAIRLGRVTP